MNYAKSNSENLKNKWFTQSRLQRYKGNKNKINFLSFLIFVVVDLWNFKLWMNDQILKV